MDGKDGYETHINHTVRLRRHGKEYEAARERIDYEESDMCKYRHIEKYLKGHRLKCYKYHASLDAIVQDLPCLQAFIEVSADLKHVKITNRNPNAHVNQDEQQVEMIQVSG